MAGEIKNIVIADDDQDDVDLFQSAVDETCSHLNLSVAMDGTKLMDLLEKQSGAGCYLSRLKYAW